MANKKKGANPDAEKKQKKLTWLCCAGILILVAALVLFVWPGLLTGSSSRTESGAKKTRIVSRPVELTEPGTAPEGEPPLKGQKVEVGGFVNLGTYEQDGDPSTQGEPLRWLVVDVQDGNALLLSKYVIAKRPFNQQAGVCTWENSDIRAWLNEEFLANAFTSSERSYIMTVKVTADTKAGAEGVDQGADTDDRVFLLSGAEAEDYFFNGVEAVYEYTLGKATWAAELGYYESVKDSPTLKFTLDEWKAGFEKDATCNWWLRTMGRGGSNAMYIHMDGKGYVNPVQGPSIGVRPAIWVKIG